MVEALGNDHVLGAQQRSTRRRATHERRDATRLDGRDKPRRARN